jgi:hypothetical protein
MRSLDVAASRTTRTTFANEITNQKSHKNNQSTFQINNQQSLFNLNAFQQLQQQQQLNDVAFRLV